MRRLARAILGTVLAAALLAGPSNGSFAQGKPEPAASAAAATPAPASQEPKPADKGTDKAAVPGELSAEQQAQLDEAARLDAEVKRLDRAGQYSEAISPAEQAVRISAQVLGEKHPAYAARLAELADLYQHAGKYAKAEPLLLQVLEINKKTLGEKHLAYGWSLNNLALLYHRMGEYAKAEPLLLQAFEILNKTLGETHPDCATVLSNLAVLYEAMGDYAKAEPLFLQALEIYKKTLGEKHPNYPNALHSLASLYKAKGDYVKAEPLYLRALEILKKTLGETHPNYATPLHNLASLYEAKGDYAKAEPLYLQAFEIFKKTRGEEHHDYAIALNNLVSLYAKMDNYAKAEPLFLQVLEIRKKTRGVEHPDYAASLADLARLYKDMGDKAKAEALFLQVLEIRKKTLGETHPAYGGSLSDLALLYNRMGEYTKAEPMLVQAFEICKKTCGEEHPDYAASLSNLAGLYQAKGEYAKAEPMLVQALEIEKKTRGEEHPEYATSLACLASLYQAKGDYAKAEPLYLRALEIRKKTLGDKTPVYATTLANLADLHQSVGEYAKARVFSEDSLRARLAICQKTLPWLAEARAMAFVGSGNGPWCDYLLELLRKLPEPGQTEAYSWVWNTRRLVSTTLRQRRQATISLPEAAQIYARLDAVQRQLAELTWAPPEPNTLEARRQRLRELDAQKEQLEGQLASLSGEFRRSLQMHDAQPADLMKVLPEDVAVVHIVQLWVPNPSTSSASGKKGERTDGTDADRLPVTMVSWHDAENFCRKLSESAPEAAAGRSYRLPTEAEWEYACRAGTTWRYYFGFDQTRIGDYAWFAGNTGTARPVGQKIPNAWGLYDMHGNVWEWCADRYGALYYRNSPATDPPGHPSNPQYAFRGGSFIDGTAWHLRSAYRYGRVPEWSHASQGFRVVCEMHGRELPKTDSSAARANQQAEKAPAAFGPDAPPLATAPFGAPQAKKHQEEWAKYLWTRAEVTNSIGMKLVLIPPGKFQMGTSPQRIQQFMREAEEEGDEKWNVDRVRHEGPLHEVRISKPFFLGACEVTEGEYQKVISAHQKPAERRVQQGEWQYEAFVLRSSKSKQAAQVSWVHLGPIAPINWATGRWRSMIAAAKLTESAVSTFQRMLRQAIWDKIEPSIGGCSRVVIIPDGDLNFLPWAALPGRQPGTCLLEDYALAIAPGGPQLYEVLTAPRGAEGGLLLAGGVTYDTLPTPPADVPALLAAARSAPAAPSRAPALTNRLTWAYLPGTEGEAVAIGKLWGSGSGALVLKGSGASEDALRHALPQSRFVHLATHGFFADPKFRSMFALDPETGPPLGETERLATAGRETVTTRNPLLLSGVVLAGANLPPKTDSLGLPTGEDGILTAEEIAALDLRNTELVVLSACDTGLGSTAGGEGVLGLQRAFHLAGAQTVVASLWKVNDRAAQTLMGEFYRNLWIEKMPKLEALRQAQLTMLHRYEPQSGQLLRGPGKIRPVDPEALSKAQPAGPSPLPPFYWAGFVLSGDWR